MLKEKRRIKKALCIFLTVILSLEFFSGCRSQEEKNIHQSLKVSELEYTLDDDDIDAF